MGVLAFTQGLDAEVQLAFDAADGAQANADGTLSETQKIFPAGKQGAVLLAGAGVSMMREKALLRVMVRRRSGSL